MRDYKQLVTVEKRGIAPIDIVVDRIKDDVTWVKVWDMHTNAQPTPTHNIISGHIGIARQRVTTIVKSINTYIEKNKTPSRKISKNKYLNFPYNLWLNDVVGRGIIKVEYDEYAITENFDKKMVKKLSDETDSDYALFILTEELYGDDGSIIYDTIKYLCQYKMNQWEKLGNEIVDKQQEQKENLKKICSICNKNGVEVNIEKHEYDSTSDYVYYCDGCYSKLRKPLVKEAQRYDIEIEHYMGINRLKEMIQKAEDKLEQEGIDDDFDVAIDENDEIDKANEEAYKFKQQRIKELKAQIEAETDE